MILIMIVIKMIAIVIMMIMIMIMIILLWNVQLGGIKNGIHSSSLFSSLRSHIDLNMVSYDRISIVHRSYIDLV